MPKEKIIYAAEILIVLAIAAIFLIPAMATTEFHIDEAHWISTSNMFESYAKAEFNAPIWHESHTTLTNPPVPRYLIGVSRFIGGYRLPDLNKLWDYEKNRNFNIKVGAMPSEGLIWWSRLPMAILAILSILLGYIFAKEIGGRTAGGAWLILSVFNGYFITMVSRAMAESSILFFTLATIACCVLALQSYPEHRNKAILWLIAAGVGIGLAAGSKLNGFAAIAGVGVIILIKTWGVDQAMSKKFRDSLGMVFLVSMVSLLVFWGTYPYLWPNPVGRTMKMLNNRVSEMTYQSNQHSPDHIDNIQERVTLIPTRIFQDYATGNFNGAFIFNLGMTGVGMAVLATRGRKENNGKGFANLPLAVLAVGAAVSLPTFFSMLDWDRYYLFPVVFSNFFIAIGAGWIWQQGRRPKGRL